MNKDIMRAAGFEKEVDRVDQGLCPTCGKEIGPFRNDIARKEFKISGMCQDCQDLVFGKD